MRGIYLDLFPGAHRLYFAPVTTRSLPSPHVVKAGTPE